MNINFVEAKSVITRSKMSFFEIFDNKNSEESEANSVLLDFGEDFDGNFRRLIFKNT